eukprot:scaffold2022_cov63-Phaeocystis_antarctica.AAC.5
MVARRDFIVRLVGSLALSCVRPRGGGWGEAEGGAQSLDCQPNAAGLRSLLHASASLRTRRCITGERVPRVVSPSTRLGASNQEVEPIYTAINEDTASAARNLEGEIETSNVPLSRRAHQHRLKGNLSLMRPSDERE